MVWQELCPWSLAVVAVQRPPQQGHSSGQALPKPLPALPLPAGEGWPARGWQRQILLGFPPLSAPGPCPLSLLRLSPRLPLEGQRGPWTHTIAYATVGPLLFSLDIISWQAQGISGSTRTSQSISHFIPSPSLYAGQSSLSPSEMWGNRPRRGSGLSKGPQPYRMIGTSVRGS